MSNPKKPLKPLPGPATAPALIDELRHCAGREVKGARAEIQRSRALIGEAIAQLNASFHSMEEQSQRQRSTITELIGPDGDGSPGVRQFAQASAGLIAELTGLLADDSRESVRTVQLIDQMVQHLDGLFELLNTLKVERALDLAMKSTFTVSQVRNRVEESADREMNASIEARTKADVLLARVEAINRSLAAGMSAVSGCTDQIRKDVSNAVRVLQFEDIVTQSLAAANTHLDRLFAINQDAIHLQALMVNLDEVPDMRQRALDAYASGVRRKGEAWEDTLHKPVSQSSLKAGDVELF